MDKWCFMLHEFIKHTHTHTHTHTRWSATYHRKQQWGLPECPFPALEIQTHTPPQPAAPCCPKPLASLGDRLGLGGVWSCVHG